MPSEDTKTLEFNQYHKSDKTSFIIYADLKSLTVKIDGCKKNPEKLMSTILLLKHIEISIMYKEVKITWKRFVNPLGSTKWR